jgi:demethylmenaquinone methyltransferase/2-methoxy-6-polyprenyl-1,4-benzoquinol methylase
MTAREALKSEMPKALSPENRPSSTGAVREMFNSIAPTYDLLNSVLSVGLHRLWERKLVASLRGAPAGECADLCTGTGALVPRLARRFASVTGVDISPQMLAVGRKRYRQLTSCDWVEADAQELPFESNRFDAVTISYGVRNLPDLTRGLTEAHRITKSGGELAVLEFGQPRNRVWRYLFSLYGEFVMPVIGSLISGSREPYEYLPKTAAAFPCGADFEALLRASGWTPVRSVPLFGGVAFLYLASKPKETL